jgi:glutamyl-tRNA(Gln) amidotransferase subunit E
MRAEHGDALILVWGSEADTETACQEIAIRAREATEGIPSDTRQALKDGTNGFERVLPGADRMYPDTDLPPLEIRQKRLDAIEAQLPEYVWDRAARYQQMGLSPEMVTALCRSPRAELFDKLVRELVDAVTDDEVYAVFKAHAEGRLAREGVFEVLGYLAALPPGEESETSRVEDVFAAHDLSPVDEKTLRGIIDERLATLDPQKFPTDEKKCRYLIGELRRDLVGRVEARTIARLVHNRLQVPLDGQTKVEAQA